MKLPNDNQPAAFPHRVLLTFDDGPSAVFTNRILDELARLEPRAVFFVEGRKLAAPGMQAMVERAAGEGHRIGNHGYSHSDLTQLSGEEIRSEIRRTEDLIGHLDRGIKLFRPAFGRHDDRVDEIAAELGYTLMLWNVDGRDWDPEDQPALWVDHTAGQIRRRQAGGRRRSVCLLHDVYASTAENLGRLIARLGELPHTAIAQYDPMHPEALRIPGEPLSARVPGICPPDAIGLRVDDALVLARPGINTLFVLNETASFLWDSLAGGACAEESARRLAEAYGIPEPMAARDVQMAIAGWRRRGISGPPRPEHEDPGAWPINYGDPPARAEVHFQETRAYRFLELGFTIRFESLELAAAIHPRFANLEAALEDAGGARHFEIFASGSGCVLRENETVLACHPSPAALAYRLFFEIVRLAHRGLDPMAWLHAACVGNASATILLVANNGSGKSTLCAALARSGFQAFCDDRVFLDCATQRPAATPNSITLKRGSWPVLLPFYPEIERLPIVHSEGEELRFLGPLPPADRLLRPVTHVFFPRFQAASPPRARALTAIQALDRMVAADGWISSELRHLERFLGWVREVRCFDLTYADLDSAMAQIQGCLSL